MNRKAATLLLTASALAIGTHSAHAAEVIFSNSGQSGVQIGERISQVSGVTQIKLDSGAMLSFVDGAEYQINADGTVELFSGTVTVTGAPDGMAIVRMPDGAEGQVVGAESSASFTVNEEGESAGHTLTGTAMVMRGRNEREFRAGEFWQSSGRRGLRQVVASNDGPAATPGERTQDVEVADMGEGGPVAAAQNGLPVSLGDALAAAGASSDILAAARNVDLAAGNPSLDTFPTGDLALLVAAAADLERFNGGTPFPAAQADIIRTYLGFLADGGSGAQFLTTYAGFLGQYLDTIRAGNLPSEFALASLADINAFLGYSGRTGAIDDLAAADQVLANRYLAFLGAGGNMDQFASTFTDLVNAYFEFVRAGGDPDSFGGASQAVLDDYIAFLAASGLEQQLSDPDQTLLAAYNANGGLQFARDFQTALAAYFAFLESGQLPSGFTQTDLDVLQAYLEQLQAAGLLGEFLGDQADFYASYLAFVQGGGDPDDFAGLNANIFSGFAADLNAYYTYLLNGGVPSEYQPLTQAQIASYIAALQAQGATGAFLDDLAGFYTDYAAFLAGGGNPDVFTGLPVLNLGAFADALNAYAAFLNNGGLPAGFTATELDVLANYVSALQAAGEVDARLGANADLLEAYFAFLAGGGSIDLFPGLPIYATYVDALENYFAFLNNGGLPSDFDALTPAQIESFLAALNAAGGFQSQLGDLSGFYAQYFAFIGAGNDPATFAGLPVYQTYVTQLNAYFDFLAGGGLPADFGGLSQQLIAQYLAALNGVIGGLDAFDGLDMFADDYAAFVLGGGDPAQFAGLPIYATYVAQLNQYFAFLAGGGLPGDFTGLDQATIDAYLAALSNVTGGLDAFGALNGNFDAYIAFLLGGGDPTEFAGLPVYASYVTALNDYFAFLAGGGLPQEYTVLDAATIEAYLAALTNVTGGLDAFNGLNSFFAAYSAFVLGGGDPEDFAGLPVYTQYLTAISEFYAFLLGGGLPSEFTGLTAREVEAYLAALEGAGLLATTFDGEVLTFFNTYLAFLSGGGDPDQFDNLPGGLMNMFADLNGWQFGTDALRIARTDAEVDDDGRITRMTVYNPSGVTTDYSNRTADLREHGRIGNDVAWTRYFRGAVGNNQPNVSEHLLVGTPATNLPTSGTVQYALVGGTAPTNRRGEAGSVGFFDGELGVSFGTATRIGLNFDLFVETEGYRVQTAGGAADPTNGGLTLDGNGRFENQNMGVTRLTGTTCAGFCQSQVFGGLFGDGGDSAGFTYNVFDQAANNAIQGVAVFQAGGADIGGLGTAPDVPAPTGTPLLLNSPVDFAATNGVKFNITSPTNVNNNFDAVTVTFNDDQGVTAIDDNFQPREIGTATVTDVSSNARFAIGRWTDGEYIAANPFETTDLSASQGLHYLLAAPTTGGFMVPTTGRIDYDLVAATAPTIGDGSLAPGQFEADMAILFGTTHRIAMEGTITLPQAGGDYVYAFSSDGGLANAEQSDTEFRVTFGRNVNFQFVDDQITTPDNCTNCVIQFAGHFAGEDINELGVTYTAQNGTFGQQISGAAIFGNGVYDDGASGDVRTGQYVVFVGADSTSSDPFGREFYDRRLNLEATYDTATGAPIGFTLNDNLDPALGAAELVDTGTDSDGNLSWGRWRNGQTDGTFFGQDNVTLGQAGLHIFSGTAATSLPTTGTILYDLIGNTTPTLSDGRTGTLDSAQAVVAFGSQAKLGLDFSVTADGSTYNVTTPGGLNETATNGLNVTAGNIFGLVNTSGNGGLEISGTGSICADTQCRVDLRGAFYGDGSATPNIGLAYDIGAIGGLRVTGTFALGPNGDFVPDMGGGTDPIGIANAAIAISGPRDGSTPAARITLNDNSDMFMLDGDGAVTSYERNDFLVFDVGTASSSELQEAGGIRIGRWSDGTIEAIRDMYLLNANSGLHYMVASPSTLPLVLPTSGLVNYELLAATSPTYGDGSTAPGSLDAALTIDFGALKLGFAAQIEMPGAGGSDFFVATTPGGVVNPSFDLVTSDAGMFVININNPTTPSGYCVGSCSFSANASFGADGTDNVGLVYQLLDNGAFDNSISGAAIFGAESTGGGSGNTGGNPTSDFTGERSDVVYYTFRNGSLVTAFGGTATLDNGALTQVSSVLGTANSGTTTVVEAGDVGDVAWARWTNGTVDNSGILGGDDIEVGANGGYHVFAGDDTVTLPGGTINYELIGKTSATDSAGSTPGTLTGDLAISFESSRRVGYDLMMEVGGRSWSVATNGGAANPQSSDVQLVLGSGGWTFGGSFTSTSGTVTSTGDTCAPSCFVNVSGTLYGQGAAYAALAMNVTDVNSTGTVTASAIGIFGQEGAGPTGSAPTTTQDAATFAAAPSGSDWDRWNVGDDTGITSGSAMAMAPGIDALQMRGIQFSAEQLKMLEAHLASQTQ